ncbi:hypothetical protein AB07_3453 [Citrobacter freundii]|nr:hypothetical protein AB07_3453 [Citrobacter freundii]
MSPLVFAFSACIFFFLPLSRDRKVHIFSRIFHSEMKAITKL